MTTRADIYLEALAAVRTDPTAGNLAAARVALDQALDAGNVRGQAAVIEELNQVERDLIAAGPMLSEDYYRDQEKYEAAETAGLLDEENPDTAVARAVAAATAAAAAATAGALASRDGAYDEDGASSDDQDVDV